MLVSGGQILAIDRVYTDSTLSGDGVQKRLGVKTDVIATTKLVSDTSAKLQSEIDVVSGNFNYYYPKSATSGAQQIQDAFDNFKTTQTIVSAGKNVGVYSAYNEAGAIVYTVSADDVEQREIKIVGTNGVSAKYDNAASAWDVGVSANFVTTDKLDDYYTKSETSAASAISAAFAATSSWANETFQPSGNYLSANALGVLSAYYTKEQTSGAQQIQDALDLKQNKVDMSAYQLKADMSAYQLSGDYVSATTFAEYKTKVEQEFENTSAWALSSFQLSGNYVSADTFTAYQQKVEQDFVNTSAWANSAFQAKGDYVSATDFNIYKEEVEQTFADTSAWANETFQPKGDYLSANALNDISGKWEAAYNTVNANSAYWNEASAFSANSGMFLTPEGVTDPGLAYFLKKDEETSKITWSGVDLSNLGKMYGISSLSDNLYAGISADPETNEPFYVVSAASAATVVLPDISGNGVSAWKDDEQNKYIVSANIVGNQGVSAEYNSETNQWDVGISANNCYASYAISMKRVLNRCAPDVYTEQYNVGQGVTYNSETNKLSVDEGMWHVTIRAKVANTTVDTNYYDVTLTCNSNSISVQFDNSYQHEEYVSLDYDLLNQNGTAQIEPVILNAPTNAYVTIERLQLHRVIAGFTVNEAGGHNYYAGDGINIEDDYIKALVSSGLKIGTDRHIEVQPGSGVYIDENNKISLRLGKGLTFSGTGEMITIETDSDVNEVVDIVENLKQELDGKLTTNMNISDAKAAGCPWDGDTSNINNIAASFFTIPLQHNLSTASEISFFATQGLGQNDADPLIVGILEYNFDYFEADASAPNGVKTRSQTQWIADTGPIWYDTPDINGNVLTAGAGRYTYKLKNVTVGSAADITGTDGTVYHNEFGPALRSDRAYYLALYTYSPNSYKYFLCDEGYAGGINNTDPAISFRKTGTNYTDANGDTHTIDRNFLANVKANDFPFSMSGMQYWDRHTNDANNMKRPYTMIRNPRL